MGQTTTNTQVWTPDSTDLGHPDVYLATMSASIENGIGARLAAQEVAVGLKASVPDQTFVIPWGSAVGSAIQIPYTVASSTSGDFNQGLTLAGGIVTVQTKGMYLVSAGVGTYGAVQGHGVKIFLQQNSNTVNVDERIMNDSTNWVNSSASAVMNCVPGDTLSAKGLLTGASFTSTLKNSGQTTFISVVMVQAVP